MSSSVAWCVQHVPFEGPARLGPLLRDRGFDVRVVAVHAGDRLPSVGEEDVVVLTGGPMSAHDARLPWMAPEREWVRKCIEARTRILGICLGSQLLAVALGAQVRPNAYREVGWFPLRAESEDPLARALASAPAAFHWHGERWELPSGARRLASSEACDHQAFAYGDHVLALQMHLEMTVEGATALCDHCAEDLAPGPYVQTREAILGATSWFAAAHVALEAGVDAWLRRDLAVASRSPSRGERA